MRDDAERLRDILDAISAIERYTSTGRDRFDEDELVRTWVLYHLRNVGEAARSVSDATRELAPQIPWPKIVGMRHVLVHQYFAVDADIVWSVVEADLPGLRREIEALLTALGQHE